MNNTEFTYWLQGFVEMNAAPTSIMLRNAGAWQIYDVNKGEVK